MRSRFRDIAEAMACWNRNDWPGNVRTEKPSSGRRMESGAEISAKVRRKGARDWPAVASAFTVRAVQIPAEGSISAGRAGT